MSMTFFDKQNPSYNTVKNICPKPFLIKSMQFADTVILYPSILGTPLQLRLGEEINNTFDQIIISAILFYPITKILMGENGIYSILNLFFASLVGLVITALLVVITEYFT